MPPDALPITEHSNFYVDGVVAEIAGLEHGAGFVVFVRGGHLDTLEGYSYDEPWPEAIHDFQLSYRTEPRNVRLPDV